ncbi:DUF3365 domain-containing protein [Shimia sp. R9_3]|uniref:c-type heme family protein n=1 Tax=Shimia sp. R9_3 TaxID=2821113 RepID=UPI001AD9BA69|nr:DUF3365 domain-containing protein [Shimia sp. R9_3]MBO9401869.1 DUF3365 domain-containing protein [Shimia sp. R9_3]
MTTLRIVLLGGFTCLAIYLFATAPPPLKDGGERVSDCQHPVTDLFAVANHINAAARGIYTKRIVGGGMAAGLKFGEEWQEPGVEQGPLPALLLRETAAQLEALPPRLGLYLGSDAPINPSNLFSDAQMRAFEQLKQTRAPVFSEDHLAGQVAMYPDLASVAPCVSCHNEHKDSPKTDWQLNDVMGATTWTYPSAQLSTEEFWTTIEALFVAVERTYSAYLAKTDGFEKAPVVGAHWPAKDSYQLPETNVFVGEVRSQVSDGILKTMLRSQRSKESETQFGAANAASMEGDLSCAF